MDTKSAADLLVQIAKDKAAAAQPSTTTFDDTAKLAARNRGAAWVANTQDDVGPPATGKEN